MITSILDNDLYSFTQQAALLALYPHTRVSYEFINRNPSMKFSKESLRQLRSYINSMANLRLSLGELDWLKEKCPFFPEFYWRYLRSYRFNPDEVRFELDGNDNLSGRVEGDHTSTILWEVPLLALISQAYYTHVARDWNINGQRELARSKAIELQRNGVPFADMGTRRRRHYDVHSLVVEEFSRFTNFVGTSNVHLARRYNVRPIGTQSHQWYMVHQVLHGIRHSNKAALEAWNSVYRGRLGIALSDTLGVDAFLEDFDPVLSRLYDGTRHDSGCPYEYVDKLVAHYKKLGIDPMSKTIVFSDGLDVKTAVAINSYCHLKIRSSFGIGTFFTNDFLNSLPLSIVIKLRTVNGIPVVKLSDSPTKATGDKDAQRVTRWLIKGTPLDD